MSVEGREEGNSHSQPCCPASVSTALPAHRQTHREEGRGWPQHPPCGTPRGDRTVPQPPGCGLSAGPGAAGSWLTRPCRSGVGPGAARRVPDEGASCLRLEEAGRCRAAHPRSAHLGRAGSACAATRLPPCPDEPGSFPTSPPPSLAASPAHTLPPPAPFPTSPGMPLRCRPLSGLEGAGRLGAGARQSRHQKSLTAPPGGECAASRQVQGPQRPIFSSYCCFSELILEDWKRSGSFQRELVS